MSVLWFQFQRIYIRQISWIIAWKFVHLLSRLSIKWCLDNAWVVDAGKHLLACNLKAFVTILTLTCSPPLNFLFRCSILLSGATFWSCPINRTHPTLTKEEFGEVHLKRNQTCLLSLIQPQLLLVSWKMIIYDWYLWRHGWKRKSREDNMTVIYLV